ncbi:MAG TPA: flagellar basal-body MS-ring/collar protein FliF [Kofleriaceae bacterium]|nr:flagellar basal-body MS-ring/collar protein FliF [Kofleriaceae bacterium]
MSDPAPNASSSGAAGANGIVAQAKALWTKLPARARTAAIASTVAIVGLVGYLILNGGGGSWKNVTDGLSANDAIALIGDLDKKGIPHRLEHGKDVLVPAGKLDEARLIASANGLPKSRKDITDFKPGTLADERERRLQEQGFLQNQLTNNLERLGPIESAEVTIAPAQQSVFVTGGSPATASVTVHLRPGVTLSPSQVRGLKQFIASGVRDLKVENVSVIDQDMNPLSGDTPDEADQEHSEEQDVVAKVLKVIEPVVGPGKVRVTAHIEYDRRTITKTEQAVVPGAVLSTQTQTSAPVPPATITSGVAGTTGNLPGAPAPTTTPVPGAAGPSSQTINNENTHITTQTEDPANRVARTSVVVLLDQGVDENGDAVARTPDELTKLTKMAHDAAGLHDDRGDQLTVESMAFAPAEAPPVVKPTVKKPSVPMPFLIGGGAVALVALALLLRRKKKQPAEEEPRIALPAPVAELERALTASRPGEAPALGDAGAAPALPSGRSLEERVVGAVKNDLHRASRVLAAWLAEPDPGAQAAATHHAKTTPAAANAKGARA